MRNFVGMTIHFKGSNGRDLSYSEASEHVRRLVAGHLGIALNRLAFTMTDIPDPLYTKTLFHFELDGEDLPPDIDRKIRAFVQSLGFCKLGIGDVPSV